MSDDMRNPAKCDRKRIRFFGIRFYLGLIVITAVAAAVFISAGIYSLLENYSTVGPLAQCVFYVLVSIIITWILSSTISSLVIKPVVKLRMAMNEVAAGNYEVRLENSSIRDISHLNETFNKMACELAKTEILQTDFVASVSHEIKTPVAAIKGFTEILQDKNLNETEREEVLNRIIANTDRLSNLVSSVLLLSRIENGTQRKNCVSYRLDEQIRQAFLMFENEWEKKELDFDIELDDIEFSGDESMLMHVWLNLISNAVKFSPRGGLIGMYLSRQDGAVKFVIEDSGPGILPGTEKQIFGKFYQGDSSHKGEGNGLGLSLVKNILDRNNGTVTAENMVEGGSRFTVILNTAK